MAKILLVEDDNNLREIYGERLMAEGYDIVSASDGEEALQTAVTEKPDLIISDVMMPKISGFDMLDILRQTPETKNVKIIMMTALSQAEDKTRADKLGADKYLVKSQVTLEDVARVVHDLLGDDVNADDIATAGGQQASTEPTPTMPVTPVATVAPLEPTVVQEPVAVVTPPATVTAPPEPIVATQPDPQSQMPVPEPIVTPTQPDPVVSMPPEPVATPTQSAPLVPPVAQADPQPADTTVAAPSTMPAPEPSTAQPATQATSFNMPAATTPVAVPQTNPISGNAPDSIDAATAQAQTAQAEGSQAELQVVAQQIEQFVASPSPEVKHEEPVHEPTQQDIIHAQNAADEPEIVSAQPVTTGATPNIPPAVPLNTSSPEPASSRKKIISPINGDGLSMPDIHALYEQELAREAANSPVINPTSGQVVNAPPEPAAQNLDGVQNPISTAAEISQEVAPPPLETVDATQITGVYASEEEAELAAAAEGLPTDIPAQVPTPPPSTLATQQPSNNPSDPNNIAL